MEIKEKIIELRKLIPIPIQKAKDILISCDGDVNASFEKYKWENLQLLANETGHKIEEIELVYKDQKYDLNKTLRYFKRIFEDQQFDQEKLVGVSDHTFQLVHEFLRIENHEELLSAILMDQFESIHSFFTIQLELTELSDMLAQIRVEYLKIQWSGNFKKDFKMLVDFKRGDLYQNALKKWDETKIAFDRNYGILRRNYDRKYNKG